MTRDDELVGLDPYSLFDGEAARLGSFFSRLTSGQWSAPSRCAGWSVRDVLCHLAASEQYHCACLEGRVAAFFADGAAQGLSDLDAWNEAGVRAYDGRGEASVLDEWRESNAGTRLRFRECDGVDIDSSIGAYPARRQAFHVAQELALFSTIATFGTANDITVAELAIETFYPADDATAALLAKRPWSL